VTKKIALLDVDGVLLDMTPALISYIQETYDVSINKNHITDWDWDYCLGFPEGLTEEFWTYVWHIPAKPYPYANVFIDELKDRGYYVHGISRRKDWAAQVAAKRDFEQLNFNDYSLVDGDKSLLINRLWPEAEFILEDSPTNAVEIGTNTNIDVYLLDRPWNSRCITVTNAWSRVFGYNDVLRAIDLDSKDSYFS